MDEFFYEELLKHIYSAHSLFSARKENFPERENSYRFNIEYLTKKEQDSLYGLYLFIKAYPELNNHEIFKMIKLHPNKFPTLIRLIKECPDLIQELRIRGFGPAAQEIAHNRMMRRRDYSSTI